MIDSYNRTRIMLNFDNSDRFGPLLRETAIDAILDSPGYPDPAAAAQAYEEYRYLAGGIRFRDAIGGDVADVLMNLIAEASGEAADRGKLGSDVGRTTAVLLDVLSVTLDLTDRRSQESLGDHYLNRIEPDGVYEAVAARNEDDGR